MARRPSLKFATFNLYNLQIPNELMYHNNKYTKAQYEKKIKWTAGLLKKIDADIIGFQELWHPNALKEAFVAAAKAAAAGPRSKRVAQFIVLELLSVL